MVPAAALASLVQQTGTTGYSEVTLRVSLTSIASCSSSHPECGHPGTRVEAEMGDDDARRAAIQVARVGGRNER